MWIGSHLSTESGSRDAGARRAFAFLLVLGVALVPAACGPQEADELPDGRPTEETIEASPPGETVERLRIDERPGMSVYEPPPDLARRDVGVVFVPSKGRQ